ncbi:hypothetical protein D3C76_541450 [compost metagenome]
MQQIAHHAVDHRLDRLVGEVEDDIALVAGGSGRRPAGGAGEALVALNDLSGGRGALPGRNRGVVRFARRRRRIGTFQSFLQQRRVTV